MYAIGIDIGTTSICGVLLDLSSGKIVRSRTENSNAFIETPNDFEKIQDPGKIIPLAEEILNDLLCDGVGVIGVTGQMHGIVYLDQNGKAVSPLFTWQDARGNLPYRDGKTYASFLGSAAGYGNVTDFYNRENHLRPAEAVTYSTVHDYFVMVLTGRKTPLMHTSDAASLGLFDLKTNKFTYDVTLDVTGDFALAGSYRGIPVSVAIGDNQASVFSTLADENDLLINIGTGSQISVVSETPITAEGIECRPYFDGKYLIVGAALCGGRAFSVLKDFYMKIIRAYTGKEPENVYRMMDALLAAREPGDATLKVDTRFDGTRADPTLRGSITDIGIGNFDPAELAYGVLDGMIGELYEMYRKMESPRTGVVGSGNGVRRNLPLMKLAEEKFGAKLRLPAHVEEAAFGAALFGLVVAGILPTAAEAQKLIAYEN